MNSNGKVALTVLGVLGVSLTLALVGLVIFLVSRQSSQPASDEEAIGDSFFQNLPRDWIEALDPKEEYVYRDIQIEGEWAILEFGEVDTTTGELQGEPGLMILKKIDGEWVAAYDHDLFDEWLWQLPESLIPYESKVLYH